MWDLPRPGLEPVSPVLASRFSTTAPPGKPRIVFWETSILLSSETAPIYISTTRVLGYPFLHILANICYLCCCFDRHLTGMRWYLLWFKFSFLWWLTILGIFSRACWPSVCLLWKNVYSGLLPIFQSGCLVFCYWDLWAVYIFWILTPYWSYNLQIFSPIQ